MPKIGDVWRGQRCLERQVTDLERGPEGLWVWFTEEWKGPKVAHITAWRTWAAKEDAAVADKGKALSGEAL